MEQEACKLANSRAKLARQPPLIALHTYAQNPATPVRTYRGTALRVEIIIIFTIPMEERPTLNAFRS